MSGTSDDIGYGQLTPWDSSGDSSGITFLVKRLIARIETMKPVKVMKVSGGGGALAAAGTVDVLPLVNQLDGNGNPVKHATIHGIPWWRLQGGAGAVILDPKVGDIGMVLCADRDISSVVANKAQSNPGSYRKHNVADGIYVGSILGLTPTQYLDFVDAGGLKLVDSLGNSLLFSSGGAQLTSAAGEPITLVGPTNVDGTFHATGATTFDSTVNIGGALTAAAASFSGSVELAGGATLRRFLTGSISLTAATFAAGASNTYTATVTGAQTGDFVVVDWHAIPAPQLTAYAYVSGANTVSVTLTNASPSTVISATVTPAVLVIGTT